MNGLSEAIDATIIVDDRGIIVEANVAALAMIGKPLHDLIGASVTTLVHGLAQGEGEIDRADASVTLPAGELPVHAWRRRAGPGRSAIILRDATEWRATQGVLAMIVAGVEQGVDAFEITDSEGKTEYANPALERALGRAPFDVLGEPITKFLEDDDAVRVTAALQAGEAWRGEVICRHAGGERRHHELALTPVVDLLTGDRRFVVVRRDITARVAAERQVELLREHVIRADRLSVLGHLAASVAHDVNNPATFILANLRLSLDELNAWSSENPGPGDRGQARIAQIAEMLSDAVDGTERVVALVREMRQMSTRERPSRERVQLADVAHDALRLTRVQTRAKARLVEDLALPAAVMGDRLRLGQVVVNLLINAADSIPDGDSASHRITIATREQNGFVELSVSDTGRGIDGGDVDRVFETWFTTKKREDGPGLGLAISREIVVDLGGTLTAAPRAPGPGAASTGSVFTMRFPSPAT